MNYAEQTSYTIGTFIHADTPIILPIGAVEAHGPHLPLETDNVLVEGYSEKIAVEVNGLVLPVLPFGQVWSLQHFPGSLSLSNQTLSNIIVELAAGLYQQGNRLFVLVSGHLGNMAAMKEAAREIIRQYPAMRVLHLFYPEIQRLASEIREGKTAHHSYIHACEIETSLMLYLAPDRVSMELAIDDPPRISKNADYTPTPWEEFTQTAVLGEATLATEKKGKYLIEETLKICVELIKNEQDRIRITNN